MWLICGGIFILGAVSMATNFMINFDYSRQVNVLCSTQEVVGRKYLQYHFGFNCTVGIVSTFFAVAVVYFYRKRKNSSENHLGLF